MGQIRINQMGYKINSYKKFKYLGKDQEFQVISNENGQVAYKGQIEDLVFDEASKEYVTGGDFSEITSEGNYYIQIGEDKSYNFTISNKQTEICTDAILKAFYYQRCGTELIEELAGEWKHGKCHCGSSYVFRQDAESLLDSNKEELEEVDTLGGWHDAGDYGRYTVAAAKAVADLLLAYEHFEGEFKHSIGIPESILSGDDILHEIKYELDFMLKMQRDDGSVYTKVATRNFPGMIMPEDDAAPLFIFDISSPATAGFAASMAMAARVLNEFDKEYARTCFVAAEKAYNWLNMNIEELLFTNPVNILSGEYGDVTDVDERYWAAAEMYRITGDEIYHKDFLTYYYKLEDKLTLGWADVGGYGTLAYLYSEKTDHNVYNSLRNKWLNFAKELEQRSKKDGYGITLSLEDYKWGSTMILLNQCMHLIIANHLLGIPEYDKLITSNWDYLFGMNPMDISYVTGLGERHIMNPHHRPSAADGVTEPVPGLISGGPCAGLYDEAAKQLCQGLPPAKCFIDHVESYSTNEITIYWNSPGVYVGAYLSSRI
ncbi:MAG: celA [Anaerocolumna sp.]|jgi:endoglucanase|nr:celA [Anaerocolumna sp.]